ncbi:nucleotide-diphospho-sugar transferase [Zychaea mexicana]|uniref:nucleotide-diphospho-sugar transferase n=1 Tax=Zychaea mexicana TaxID=64656 RepID=UPI0022FEF80D|nr:nucleotide-diphospho-sugar transferase [Zychaea mexicana]KAI9492523.1 nucleotide-diphospho-sugar transferase [Zychaea mexicana]
MLSITRRSSCYWLQIVFIIHILGAIWYVVYRPTLVLPWQHRHQRGHIGDDGDGLFAALDDSRSWTTGPPHNPNQLTVQLPPASNRTPRVNAGFVVLVRNTELGEMLESMYEERFNRKFDYPWLFLNEEPFTEEFKRRTTAATNAKTHFGFVDESMWSYPTWINQTLAAEQREKMRGLPYGASESYRHMCRFQSGFFWRHPLFLELGWEYYWRVEPHVRYYCELDYDPFLYMKQNNKKYGFTISFVENGGTIPTLWEAIRRFVTATEIYGQNQFALKTKDTLYRFITDENGEQYNQCHFWTNFEIARTDLWQSDTYQKLFEFLDRSGGFFYERWGDAPVHSIFAALFLHKDEFHYFHDIGYKHSVYEHCPESDTLADKCFCNPANTLDYKDPMSCLTRYMDALAENSVDKDTTVGQLLRLPGVAA